MKRAINNILIGVLLSFCVACGDEDPIPMTVQRLSELSELSTVEYTISKVVKANNNDNILVLFGSKKILFTTTCHLKAGFDLGKMKEEDIQCHGKNIQITLPKAELLTMDMRPEETHLVYSESTGLRTEFTPEERNALIAQGETDIRKSVAKMGILKDAEINGKALLEQLLHELGYEGVSVTIADN